MCYRAAVLGGLIAAAGLGAVSRQSPPASQPSTSASATATATAESGDPEDRPLANRQGASHERALERFGGNRRTERAVADGLAWLAAHQRADGVWERERFDLCCPPDDRCGGVAVDRNNHELNVGLSALATLAFLGAGYTHEQGPYADTITRAFNYILAQQTSDGTFSPTSAFQIYNDAVATLAIAEASIMTRDPVFDRPLRRAVAHLARAQQDSGGWDYTAHATNRNDTSITGWVLMALKSAQAAGAPPPASAVWRMIGHFERATERDGRVWYADEGIGVQRDRATGLRVQRYGPAMVAVGLYAHATIGWRPDDAIAQRQAERLLADPPSYERMTRLDPSGLHSEYYWYYGTLALFHRGGDEWRTWNRALRDCIVEYQERPVRPNGQRRHAYGSWPPFGLKWGKWGKMGGRIYSTAINVLTLEVYYRYVPTYLSPHGLIGPRELRAYVESAPEAQWKDVLPRVARFHPDTCEPVLLWMLDSSDAAARLGAAIELGMLGSPQAKRELTRQSGSAVGAVRLRIEQALGRLDEQSAQRTYGSVTRVNDAAGMFLFELHGRAAYYGQTVHVIRDGAAAGSARVDRRFSSHDVAAATVLEGAPRAGDMVVGESAAGERRTEESK